MIDYYDSNRDEDWSDDFNDRDSDDWEEHYSISERDEVELENQMYDIVGEEGYDDESGFYSEDDSDDFHEDDENEIGQKKYLESIIKWLEKSDLIKSFLNRSGFFVFRGHLVRLEDNEVVELMDWLLDEGIAEKNKIGKYEITHVNSLDTCEVLVFVKTTQITNIPFMRNKMLH